MSVKFKLSDLHIRKQNGTFGDLTALKGDRGLTAVQVSGTQPTDPDIDVWFKDQQNAPVMVYTTDEIDDMVEQTEKNLAIINTGSTASQDYDPGEYLVYNGQLYKVGSTKIMQGNPLTPGGNIEATTIGEVIYRQPIINGTLLSNDGTAEAYGTLSYSFDPNIKVAWLRWQGKQITPVSKVYHFTIPNNIKPTQRYITKLLQGGYMQIDSDDIIVSLTTEQWSAGCICYLVG